jgi:transposase-like protein
LWVGKEIGKMLTNKRVMGVKMSAMPDSDLNSDNELEEIINFDKIKVECICPKCGKKHVMNFPWTGRGIPRKFCPQCRGSI